MGRPAEGLRRQGLASCADIPCLTPPHLSHYVFVPFWHLTTFLVTYIHSLSPLWPRNARRRDNGRTRFGNRAAPRLSRRAGRPKPRHAKNGARPALCGRDEVREGHLSSFIVLKKRRRKKSPLRSSPQGQHVSLSASATASASAPGLGQWPQPLRPGNRRPGAFWPVQSGRESGPCFFTSLGAVCFRTDSYIHYGFIRPLRDTAPRDTRLPPPWRRRRPQHRNA